MNRFITTVIAASVVFGGCSVSSHKATPVPVGASISHTCFTEDSLVPGGREIIVYRGIDATPIAGVNAARIPCPEEDEPGWNCHTLGNEICGRP